MIELIDEDMKTVSHTLKKLEKILNMLNRDVKDIEKIQIEPLEMKMMMSEIK